MTKHPRCLGFFLSSEFVYVRIKNFDGNNSKQGDLLAYNFLDFKEMIAYQSSYLVHRSNVSMFIKNMHSSQL